MFIFNFSAREHDELLGTTTIELLHSILHNTAPSCSSACSSTQQKQQQTSSATKMPRVCSRTAFGSKKARTARSGSKHRVQAPDLEAVELVNQLRHSP